MRYGLNTLRICGRIGKGCRVGIRDQGLGVRG